MLIFVVLQPRTVHYLYRMANRKWFQKPQCLQISALPSSLLRFTTRSRPRRVWKWDCDDFWRRSTSGCETSRLFGNEKSRPAELPGHRVTRTPTLVAPSVPRLAAHAAVEPPAARCRVTARWSVLFTVLYLESQANFREQLLPHGHVGSIRAHTHTRTYVQRTTRL